MRGQPVTGLSFFVRVESWRGDSDGTVYEPKFKRYCGYGYKEMILLTTDYELEVKRTGRPRVKLQMFTQDTTPETDAEVCHELGKLAALVITSRKEET